MGIEQEMKRSGRIPEKEVLAKRVAELSKGITSPSQFKQVLEQNGIKTYERNGILTGIWNGKGTRKYRLRKLGIDSLSLNRMLSKELERKKRLKRKINNNKER